MVSFPESTCENCVDNFLYFSVSYFLIDLLNEPIRLTAHMAYNQNKSLFEQIAAGDENAFRVLFDGYKNRLLALIYRMTKSSVTSEEILQEVFITIWKNRTRFLEIEYPDAFILTITRNRTIDFLRKVSKEKILLSELWSNFQHHDESAFEWVSMRESSQLIEEALSHLSTQKQSVFRLSRYDGLNHDQIATELHLSKSRVKNILVETLHYIRAYLIRGSLSLYCFFDVLSHAFHKNL